MPDETEGFEPETTRPGPHQQETGSTAQDGRRAAVQAWEASTLAAAWYAQPNDLIGGWCVMPSDQPPSSGGPEVADFCTERIAGHIAELHNASLAGDQVTVSREDFLALLGFARGVGQKTRAQRELIDRLSAAAEATR